MGLTSVYRKFLSFCLCCVFMASSIVGSSGNGQYCLGDVIKDGLKSLHLGLFNESMGFVWVIRMSIFRLNKIVAEDFCMWMLNLCDFVA